MPVSAPFNLNLTCGLELTSFSLSSLAHRRRGLDPELAGPCPAGFSLPPVEEGCQRR